MTLLILIYRLITKKTRTDEGPVEPKSIDCRRRGGCTRPCRRAPGILQPPLFRADPQALSGGTVRACLSALPNRRVELTDAAMFPTSPLRWPR